MKLYFVALLVVSLLAGCGISNAESDQMKQQLDTLQKEVERLEISNEKLITENKSMKQELEISSTKLINPKYEQIRMDSLTKVLGNESSIAHTYQVEEHWFISFYESNGKFLEVSVVTSGGPLVLIEGTYEYVSDESILKLTYYDTQTFVYSVQIQNGDLRVELIDAYQHIPSDFIFTNKGQVFYWKKWTH